MQKGKIGVTTENIFPVIKKFLYSDHEIFLRELVSNAVDATQKLKTLASVGEFKGETGTLQVKVNVDEDKKQIIISDNGIGMTQQEVEKYINQIAFSGAEEFIEKYKDKTNIIGHFGLGFYSSFMVADKVELTTKSYKEEVKAVRWTSDGTPEYTIEEVDKQDRGTEIVLHLAEDSTEFASRDKIKGLLYKYCRFLPVEIVFGKEQEWKDGKYHDTDRDLIINDVNPLWKRNPSEIKSEEYDDFYMKLYNTPSDALFNIHLNVDYPFNLTGILYFPKIKSNIDLQRNKIQLYCNQVFVTDSVEGIVPEFLTILHGVIDSPDIPLNVSRSYLQSDANVKKISSHISKKVSDKLHELFKNSREEFENKWDDLKIFMQYGIVSDEKFADRANDFVLLKNTEGEYFTLNEYSEKAKANQTDKHGSEIYLYANDTIKQHSFIETAKSKGYDVLIMDGQLDNHFISWCENKRQGVRYVRVDSDIVDRLIQKEDARSIALTSAQQETLRPVFESQLPTEDKVNYNMVFEALDDNENPVVITQNEYMRRMKEMAATGGGPYAFYGQMPDSYTVVVNGNHPLVVSLLEETTSKVGEEIKKFDHEIEKINSQISSLNAVTKDKKPEEISQEEKDKQESLNSMLEKARSERYSKLFESGKENNLVKQIVDLALLSSGMLKGENLTNFIRRSVELIEKH